MLTGAVVALGASFLTAAAGVGVLGIALAAAFGPWCSSRSRRWPGSRRSSKPSKQAEDGAAEGAERVRDANRAQADAQRNAVDAAARVRTTAVDAYRAWREAAEETTDAIRGIAQAELSRDQARLNVKQAEQDLNDLRKEAGLTGDSLDGMFKKFTDISFRPKNLIGAIQKSRGRQAAPAAATSSTSPQGSSTSAKPAERAGRDRRCQRRAHPPRRRPHREQEFIQNGISAYEPYTAAVEANEDAQRALAEATERPPKPARNRTRRSRTSPPRNARLVDVIVELKKTLTDVFRPATQRDLRRPDRLARGPRRLRQGPGVSAAA